jgi:hypothetical protein
VNACAAIVESMNPKIINMTVLALLPLVLLTLASCSSPSKPPPPVGSAVMSYQKGVPGEVIVQTLKVTATVTAIDQAKRTATLQGADGKPFSVQVGREAVNFDQVHVGDQISATLTQKLAVSLAQPEARAGEDPVVLPPETIQKTAQIIAIDRDTRTLTLQFEDGSTETFPTRPDTDLSRLKLGQREIIRVTETTAIWLEKPQ